MRTLGWPKVISSYRASLLCWILRQKLKVLSHSSFSHIWHISFMAQGSCKLMSLLSSFLKKVKKGLALLGKWPNCKDVRTFSANTIGRCQWRRRAGVRVVSSEGAPLTVLARVLLGHREQGSTYIPAAIRRTCVSPRPPARPGVLLF